MKKLLLLMLCLGIGPPLLAQSPAAPFNGTITTSGCMTVQTGNKGTVTFQVTGSWTGTIQPEGAIHGGTPFNLKVTPIGSTTAQSTVTANGSYSTTVAGLDTFLLCGATVSGTATVAGNSVQVVATDIGLGNGGGGGGGGGTPGGSNTQVQFNDSGAFGGSSAFTFTKGTGLAQVTNTGVFNQSQQNEYLLSVLNSCNPGTEWHATQGFAFGTDAMAGCVAVPNTATTQANAVSGYANSSNTSGEPGVGIFGQGRALVNGAKVWGGNFVAQDVSGLTTGVWLTGFDVNINPQNASSAYTVINGVNATLSAPNAGFFGNGHLCTLFNSTGAWSSCFYSADTATITGLFLGTIPGGSSSLVSQVIQFHYLDSSAGSHAPTLGTDILGNLAYLGGPIAGNLAVQKNPAAFTVLNGSVYNVVAYGADPTGTADSTTAVAAAIAAAPDGGTIFFPCGTYKVNPGSSFNLVTGTIIQGSSPYCTNITYTGSSSTPVWLSNSYVNGTGGSGQFIKFKDFTMLGGNISASVCFSLGTLSLATAKVQNVTFENMRVTQCGTGLVVNDVWELNIDASDIAFNVGDGIQLTDPDAITGMFLFGTRVHNNGGHGINNSGAGTVTQFEQYGGEDTYNGASEVVTGIARDWLFSGVWFENSSAQHSIDVTSCIRCTVIGAHFDHEIDAIFASSSVSYITISDSSQTNGTTNFINVPTGSTYINYAVGNRSNVLSTVGTATAQYDVDCPDAAGYTLAAATGLAVNGCTGTTIASFFSNGALEMTIGNTGIINPKGGIDSASGSAFGILTLGDSTHGAIYTRNEADAFPSMTVNNSNASSTGDIYDFQSQGSLIAGFTEQGFPFNRIQTQITAAATITPTLSVFHMTGATPVATITVPTGCATSSQSCEIKIIPDSAFTTTSVGGNIAIASTGVLSKVLIMIYDPAQSKWYPSY